MAKFASQYYDPKKAHEYYMQHRQLQGRHSTKGMSSQQKEMLSYVKQDFKTRKKKEKDKVSADYKKQSEKITKQGQKERKKISEKTKAQRAALSAKTKAEKAAIVEKAKQERERLSSQANSKIKAIRNQLKNMSPEQKKQAQERLNVVIDQIRVGAQLDKAAVTEDSKSTREGISAAHKKESAKLTASASKQRSKVSSSTKAARKTASAKAKKKKQDIDVKYEKKLDRAYSQIKSGQQVKK